MLTICFVSIFLPNFANAEMTWNVAVKVIYNDKTWKYSLNQHLTSLSEFRIKNAQIYSSVKTKRKIITELINQGYTCEQAVCYVLPSIREFVSSIEKEVNFAPTNATASFTRQGNFNYTKDKDGIKVDKTAFFQNLIENLDNSLTLYLPTINIVAEKTYQDMLNATTLRGQFSTTFYSSGQARSDNIARALSNFNGLIIPKNKTISFNDIVGERTQRNGYKMAKIIVDGKYVDGVGGGVCQASTTLYNALLLADITVNKRSPHSLTSSYVAPSFDCMVSSTSNLVFVNNTSSDIYIYACVSDKKATIKIFGEKLDYEIKRVSKIFQKESCKESVIIDREGKYLDKVKYDDERYILSYGSDAVTSIGELHYFKNDKLEKIKFLSKDKYRGCDRIVVVGTQKRPLNIPKNILPNQIEPIPNE